MAPVRADRLSEPSGVRRVGRYAIGAEIGRGGMATVMFAKLLGPVGFSRTVAVKCLHPQYAKEPEFRTMLIDEARMAARIAHPNVVQVLDVVAEDDELLLVLELVQGESLAVLLSEAIARGERVPPRIAGAIAAGVLHGLHAAHEATNDRGTPLDLVHRDVSPQNVIVGTDGAARVLDFGVAKAVGRLQTTVEGQIKGRLGYMAPEHLCAGPLDRRTDVFASAVVLWEMLVGERLFSGDPGDLARRIARVGDIEPPRARVPEIPAALDAIVMRGLAREPAKRFPTARQMAVEIERCHALATAAEVAEWVEDLARERLRVRADRLAEFERQLRDIEVAAATRPPATPAGVAVDGPPGTPRARRGTIIVVIGAATALGAIAVSLLHHPAQPEAPSIASAPGSAELQPSESAVPTPTAVPSDSQAAPTPTKPRTRQRSRADCDPPYVLQADGTRRFKRECL